jgi:hypothetical protein
MEKFLITCEASRAATSLNQFGGQTCRIEPPLRRYILPTIHGPDKYGIGDTEGVAKGLLENACPSRVAARLKARNETGTRVASAQ